MPWAFSELGPNNTTDPCFWIAPCTQLSDGALPGHTPGRNMANVAGVWEIPLLNRKLQGVILVHGNHWGDCVAHIRYQGVRKVRVRLVSNRQTGRNSRNSLTQEQGRISILEENLSGAYIITMWAPPVISWIISTSDVSCKDHKP